MKKKSPSRSAFFNPRFLISFALCAVGVSIALFAFAANPVTTALANQDPPLAYDSIAGPDGQVMDELASEPVISNAPAEENTEAAGGQIDGGACSQINGGQNPQGLTESGVAAPAGFFWSEVQHDTGNNTEANGVAGIAALQGTFRLADNFTLAQPCTINSVVIYAYQTGAPASPSPFTAFTLQIHNGRPGDPGVMVVFGDTTTNRLASSVDSTFFRLFNTAVPPPGIVQGTTRKIWRNTLSVGTTLPAGTYWLDWASTVSNGGAHFHPAKTVPGARSAAGDNGRQLTVATGVWADALDTGVPATAPDVMQDFPFEVIGIPVGGTPSPTPTATATGTATATSTPTATATASPSCGGTVLSENFDSVTAPALPAGWVASNASGAAPLWVTTTTTPDTAPNDAFIDDPAIVTDKLLDTPAISITSAAAQVTFRNFYNLESTFDGGVLEVSSPNINAGAFTDVTNAAVGGSFTSGGYNATISTAFMSPIAGRMAWSGNAGAYLNSVANLGPNVAGQTIKLRFRMASDNSVSATGWRVDTVAVTGGACPSGTPTATSTATTGGSPGGTPACPPIITHSSSQTITTGNSVSCNNGTGHTDNSYWRAFNMGTFTGGAEYMVTSVSFGVESANVTQPVTARLYTNSGGAFPAGTRTQIATTTVSVTAAQTGTVVSAPLAATVPAGTSELVMELFTPDGQAAGNLFFVGSNASAETGPSYISAAACGITTPTTTAAVGFPNMHLVFNVHGMCGGTPAPTATSTATTGGTPSPTATCPIGWAPGPVVPAVGAVRAPGNFFPANGRFYIVGGRSADVAGADFTNPFEYNPATNTWVTKPSVIPDGQVNNMACGVLTAGGTDQIYCVGGSMSQVVGTASRVFSYNPATDTFTTLTAADNWPGSQAGTFLPGGFAVNGNKLYIIGSFNANAVPPVVTGQVWQFDPTAAVGSRWLQRADFPVMRGYVPAASIGTSIYTAGGSNLDPGGTLIDTVESFRYDTAANTWTAIANIPRATGETRALVVNNQMWVLGGGRVAPNPSNQVDIYDPGSNTWTTGTPFVAARRNFPADTDGTLVFLAGGYDASGTTLLNTMEIFGTVVCPDSITDAYGDFDSHGDFDRESSTDPNSDGNRNGYGWGDCDPDADD